MKPRLPYIRVNGTIVSLNPTLLQRKRLALADAEVTEQCEGCGEPIHDYWEIQLRHGVPHSVACAHEADGDTCRAMYKIHQPPDAL